MDANAKPRAVLVPIAEVVEKDRHRKDLGELMDLCRSIEAIGLLHPIVIDQNNRLIAGARRIAAFIRNGEDMIPAYVVKSLGDASALLRAERDENTCRKDFTPSEAVALGRALEKLERPKAKERQRQHAGTAPGKPKNTSENFTEVNSRAPETREIVGAAVGMSGPTYQRAKAVIDAAEKDPETYGPIAEEMDRTGKVMRAYTKLTNAKNGTAATKSDKPNSAVLIHEATTAIDSLERTFKKLRSLVGKETEAGYSACLTELSHLRKHWKLWQRRIKE